MIMNRMESGSVVTRFKGVKDLVYLANLPPSQSHLREIEEFGFAKKLLEFANDPTHAFIQDESLMVLFKLSQEYDESIIKIDGHTVLIKILYSAKHYEIKMSCLSILVNIAGNSDKGRLLLLQNGIIENILKICQLTFNAKSPSFHVHELKQIFVILKLMTSTFLDIVTSDLDGTDLHPWRYVHIESIIQCLLLLMHFAIKHKNVTIDLLPVNRTIKNVFGEIADITARCYSDCLYYTNGYSDTKNRFIVNFNAKMSPLFIDILNEFTETITIYRNSY